MKRELCQMWNLSRAELASQDARSLLRDTTLIRLYESELRAKNGG